MGQLAAKRPSFKQPLAYATCCSSVTMTPLRADLRAYVERVNELPDFDPNSFGGPIDRETGIDMISRLYQLQLP